jgi:hypothetical protein
MIRRIGCTRLWCQKCGCEVDVVDLVRAEILADIAELRLHACAEVNNWHSFEGPDGTLVVCLGSVLKSM